MGFRAGYSGLGLIGKKLTRDVSIKKAIKRAYTLLAGACARTSGERYVCHKSTKNGMRSARTRVYVVALYRFYNQGGGSEPRVPVSPPAKLPSTRMMHVARGLTSRFPATYKQKRRSAYSERLMLFHPLCTEGIFNDIHPAISLPSDRHIIGNDRRALAIPLAARRKTQTLCFNAFARLYIYV